MNSSEGGSTWDPRCTPSSEGVTKKRALALRSPSGTHPCSRTRGAWGKECSYFIPPRRGHSPLSPNVNSHTRVPTWQTPRWGNTRVTQWAETLRMRGGLARGRWGVLRTRPSVGRSLVFPPSRPAPCAAHPRALPWRPGGHSRPAAAQPARSLRTWRRRRRRQWQVMELSRNNVETRKPTGLGRCRHFFWLGVVFDTVGATLLFTGVFARLLFYDLLLYLGSIIIFFSLLWWVFWYTGNIELTAEESLKEPFHVPSSTAVNALSQRLSDTLCNVSRSLTRIRRRCAPRTFLLRSASLSTTGTARPENQLEQEDQGKDATAGAQESGDAQNLGGEALGPKPEAVVSSEGVRFPGPDAGSLGAEAGLPGPVKGSFFTHMATPEFPPSAPDQPQPLAVLSSRSLPVVPSASTRQPLALCVSRSQPVATLASAGQSAAALASTSPPLLSVASESQPAVPLPSMTQPTVVLASQNQPFVPVASWEHFSVSLDSQVHNLVPVPAQSNLQILSASQSHSPVSVGAQSHLQVPLASQSQLENIPLASQTPSSGAQAPQSEGLATPGSLIQVPTSQSFQAQPVNLWISLPVQDFQAFSHNQQTLQSISSVQEISPSQSAPVKEFQKKPVAQAFETLPPAGQELSQEFPATASPPPESQAPTSQAQQSVSPESTTTPASEMKSSPP